MEKEAANEIILHDPESLEAKLPDAMMVPEDLYEVLDFRNIFQQKQTEADKILGAVSSIAGDAATANHVVAGLKPQGTRWVVQMSDEVKTAIDNGTLKLDTNKAGEVFAQLREAGKYGDKFPITQEIIRAGIDPMAVSQALEMKAIQKQLGDMMDVLDEIGNDVAEVIQGQMNDRIGLYNSGLNLYLESRNIQDAQFRMLVVSQALKSLSDANEQMLQSIRTDARFLIEGRYRQKKGKSTEEIDERMNNINKCFEVVHRAYMLRAAIYYERNEYKAMLSTFDEYGRFLSREIKPIAPKLTEFDRTDKLLQNGKWDRRTAVFDEIGKVKKQLAGNNVYYLELEGDSCAER